MKARTSPLGLLVLLAAWLKGGLVGLMIIAAPGCNDKAHVRPYPRAPRVAVEDDHAARSVSSLQEIWARLVRSIEILREGVE